MKSIIAELWEGSVSPHMRALFLSLFHSPPPTYAIGKPKYVPPKQPCSVPPAGETGVQREAHKLRGEWGWFSSGLRARPRLGFGKKKTAICPSEGFGAPSWWRQPSWSGKSRELLRGEGVRSAIQEHPLPVGREGWLERPVAQRWGKGHTGPWVY